MDQILDLFKNKWVIFGILIVAALAFYFFVYKKPSSQQLPQMISSNRKYNPQYQIGFSDENIGNSEDLDEHLDESKGEFPEEFQEKQTEQQLLPGEDDLQTEISV